MTDVETASVGTHVWDMPSTRSGTGNYLVNFPFVGVAMAAGSVASVDAVRGGVVLTARSTVFDAAGPRFVLMRTGGAAGAWFAVESVSDPYTAVLDAFPGRYAGDPAGIAADDLLSVHPLYRLGDVFAEDGSVLTAGIIDAFADKVHFYRDGGFLTYWLSTGEVVDAGWIRADGRQFVHENPVVFPGTAVFVERYSAGTDIEAWVTGEILDVPLIKALAPGFSFVGVEYNEGRLSLSGVPSSLLGDMGPGAGLLQAGKTDKDADLLYRWDATLDEYFNYWLSDGSVFPAGWLDGGQSAEGVELPVGEGVIIYRRVDDGQVKWWVDGGSE